MSVKLHEDQHYNNLFYSQIGAIACEDLTRLEVKFLLLLDFDLHVDPDAFRRQLEDFGQELGTDERPSECCGLQKKWSQSSFKTVDSPASCSVGKSP